MKKKVSNLVGNFKEHFKQKEEQKDAPSMLNRNSTRNFTEKEIKWVDVYDILEAGLAAPRAGDLQPTKFIVVRTEDDKEFLAKESQDQFWMMKASVLIIVLRDQVQYDNYFQKRGQLLGIQTTAACIQNMVQKAHEKHLGVCWVAPKASKNIKECFDIPEKLELDAIIALGHKKDVKIKDQKIDLLPFCFFDKYDQTERTWS